MRIIDADKLIDDLEYDIANDAEIIGYVGTGLMEREIRQFDKDCKQNAIDLLLRQPTIKTKQIKYYDDDEGVWKIGRVIVDA